MSASGAVKRLGERRDAVPVCFSWKEEVWEKVTDESMCSDGKEINGEKPEEDSNGRHRRQWDERSLMAHWNTLCMGARTALLLTKAHTAVASERFTSE